MQFLTIPELDIHVTGRELFSAAVRRKIGFLSLDWEDQHRVIQELAKYPGFRWTMDQYSDDGGEVDGGVIVFDDASEYAIWKKRGGIDWYNAKRPATDFH